jgi:hypothetical protein
VKLIKMMVPLLGTMVALAGCGGSSNSSSTYSNSGLSYGAFSSAAQAICSAANTAAKGASASTQANAASAAGLAKTVTAAQDAVNKLKALSGGGPLSAARDTFVANVNQQVAAAKSAEADASSGNQSGYNTEVAQLQSLNGQGNADGSKLGAPACATNS